MLHVVDDAVAVSTREVRHGVGFAVILKTFCREEPNRSVNVPRLLSAICRAQGTRFYVYCGANEGIPIRGMPLPQRLRPVPLNFIYRRLLPDAPEPSSFRLGNFEFLDFDAY